MFLCSGMKVSTNKGDGVIEKTVVYAPYKSRFLIVKIKNQKVRFDSKSFNCWDIDGLSTIEDESVYQSPRERLDELFKYLSDEKIEKLINFLEDL